VRLPAKVFARFQAIRTAPDRNTRPAKNRSS
jgi:hypothetical protein